MVNEWKKPAKNVYEVNYLSLKYASKKKIYKLIYIV